MHNQSAPEPTPSKTGLSLSSAAGRKLMLSMMTPQIVIIGFMMMFSVAVPLIRDQFDLDADVTAWLVIAYTLTYVTSLPLYGRLADDVGIRKLFLVGIGLFFIGTGLGSISKSFPTLLLSRAIQGLGSGGVSPLCMSVIYDRFSDGERGKAIGTWTAVGPLSGMIAPVVAGFLIVRFGWRSIYMPIIVLSAVALVVLRFTIPSFKGGTRLKTFLHSFDVPGFLLLSGTTVFLVCYASSRPVTGVAPFSDIRLLAGMAACLVCFILWERKCRSPFVDFKLFGDRAFVRACLSAGMRMVAMGGINLLFPLYLVDVHGKRASHIGTAIMLHGAAILTFSRLGGSLADRWNSRWPVIIGMSVQAIFLLAISMVRGSGSATLAIGLLIAHGLGAGLALAALHHSSMVRVPPDRRAAAAGLYNMMRFSGSLLGSALVGVILQAGLDLLESPVAAYQRAFWFLSVAALMGAAISLVIKDAR